MQFRVLCQGDESRRSHICVVARVDPIDFSAGTAPLFALWYMHPWYQSIGESEMIRLQLSIWSVDSSEAQHDRNCNMVEHPPARFLNQDEETVVIFGSGTKWI